MITIKATSPEEVSNSIIVSFSYDYNNKILNNKFTAIIRKRIPKDKNIKWIYFHVNRPISSICARAKIISTDLITPKMAENISTELSLKLEIIQDYCFGLEKVGLYKIGDIEIAEPKLHTDEINKIMFYSPPQSFLILSKEGKKYLDNNAFSGR
jgi:hypothetical protein